MLCQEFLWPGLQEDYRLFLQTFRASICGDGQDADSRNANCWGTVVGDWSRSSLQASPTGPTTIARPHVRQSCEPEVIVMSSRRALGKAVQSVGLRQNLEPRRRSRAEQRGTSLRSSTLDGPAFCRASADQLWLNPGTAAFVGLEPWGQIQIAYGIWFAPHPMRSWRLPGPPPLLF